MIQVTITTDSRLKYPPECGFLLAHREATSSPYTLRLSSRVDVDLIENKEFIHPGEPLFRYPSIAVKAERVSWEAFCFHIE